MKRKLKLLTFMCFIVIVTVSLNAQEKKYHSAYNPTKLAKRLSYENFRDLKMLQTAIYNFGGGKERVKVLIDQYADASVLYFQSRYEESANLFSENQREIFRTANELTKMYKEKTEKLLFDSTKRTISDELKRALKGKKKDNVINSLLRNARFAVQKGTDYYDRFKGATKNASPMPLIRSIFYFRRAKDNIFTLLKVVEMDEDKRKELLDKYKKDMEDNKNKVFKEKVKNQ